MRDEEKSKGDQRRRHKGRSANGRKRPAPASSRDDAARGGYKKRFENEDKVTSPKRGKNYIRELQEDFLKGIFVPKKQENFTPDEFQLRAIESIAKGVDTLVVAPTGTGKTYIAVQGIAQTISSGKRAVYTAPLKALSNTKYTEFRKRFEPHFTVGLLTGDRKIDGDADVVVATTEIYRNELYNYGDNYSLVVLDEFHYLADSQRGPVWEESIILSPKNSALLMLSASVSNAEEIAEWIETVRGRPVQIITETHRPVELRLGFLHPDFGVIPLQNSYGETLREVEDFYSIKPDARFRGGRGGRYSASSSKVSDSKQNSSRNSSGDRGRSSRNQGEKK
ncbi:MAG TPA: DEAD/DEAH box helicase [Oligoflexia bacterium]|nr:DEAD/DEAH box helicase [Oligoflexia bacterium]HMP48412.1 DEAD/DEAH box helicase [Oligoflexia bacterium]